MKSLEMVDTKPNSRLFYSYHKTSKNLDYAVIGATKWRILVFYRIRACGEI